MIILIDEALDSPGNDRSFLRNNLSFLYRTVTFTQNTTTIFKEGWHNFKEIAKFYKEAMSLLGHRMYSSEALFVLCEVQLDNKYF